MQTKNNTTIKKIYHYLLFFIGIVLIVLLLYKTIHERKRHYIIDEEISKQQRYHDKIAHENRVFKDLISYREHPVAQERLAKELGYKKSSEKVIIVTDLPDKTPTPTQTTSSDKTPLAAWYHIFFTNNNP